MAKLRIVEIPRCIADLDRPFEIETWRSNAKTHTDAVCLSQTHEHGNFLCRSPSGKQQQTGGQWIERSGMAAFDATDPGGTTDRPANAVHDKKRCFAVRLVDRKKSALFA